MGTEKFVFYLLSAILVFAAGMVVSVRNAVRAVLFLVLAFFGVTSLWVAILADVGMSLLVTLNGMRPLRFENGTSK